MYNEFKIAEGQNHIKKEIVTNITAAVQMNVNLELGSLCSRKQIICLLI